VLRRTLIMAFTQALDADRRTVAERDGVPASKMPVRLRLALQNEARTPCYRFATQLGSTGRGREQGRAFEQNPSDNSVPAGTEQNTK
jgi:hypothetical protein